MSHNRNPTGRNQHGVVPNSQDPTLMEALNKYHRENITDNNQISDRLLVEYGITASARTVRRRRKDLGLTGSRATLQKMTRKDAEQLVVDQMDKDVARGQGLNTIKARLAFDTGTHLPRDFISEVMHTHDSEGFSARNPSTKKIVRVRKYPIGPHERWAGDGHDKLYSIGFPIWAVVDDATARWLGAWVVPSNRMGHIIGYLFLCLIEIFGGMPIEFSTDCGSETTQLYGLVNALREIFHPDFSNVESPAYRYLRSVHNISIERSWLRLKIEWGDSVVLAFEKGSLDGIYNANDPDQYELCQWLWPKLLRQDLKKFMDFRNGVPMRKNNNKAGPSSISRNEAFFLPQNWGGRNCLLPVDLDVIRELKVAMGGDSVLDFVTPEFSERAKAAYDSLNILSLTVENVWEIFRRLRQVMYEN